MARNRINHQAVVKSRGQSLVEFALVLPMLLLLILGALDFGRLFHTQIVITNAAREGAYYLSTHSSALNSKEAAVVTAAFNAAKISAQQEAKNSGIEAVTVDIGDCECETGGCTPTPNCKKVTVSTTVKGLLLLDSFGLGERQASVEMRVQP